MTPDDVTQAITARLREGGWKVSFAKRRPARRGIPKESNGATLSDPDRLVWIRKREPELVAATLLHEAAHVLTVPVLLNQAPESNRSDAEVVAELAAMWAGEELDVRDPESVAYILGWASDTKLDWDDLMALASSTANFLVEAVKGEQA